MGQLMNIKELPESYEGFARFLDEYERERVLNLHSMTADGANIQQITFNQSHDRNPVIRPDGTITAHAWDFGGQGTSATPRGLPIGVVACAFCTAAMSASLGYCLSSQ